MARNFIAANQDRLLTYDTLGLSVPFSVSVWVKPLSFAGFPHVFTLQKDKTITNYSVLINNDGRVYANQENSFAAFKFALTATPVVIGQWAHIAASFGDPATPHIVWLNRTDKASSGGHTDPGGADPNIIYCGYHDRGAVTRPFSGDIAGLALFNGGLTDNEVLLLSAGIHPRQYLPAKLIDYWDFAGQSLTGVNGNTFLVGNGTTVSAQPAQVLPETREPDPLQPPPLYTAATGIGRLLYQYRDSPRLAALISALIAEHDEMGLVADSLRTRLDIDESFGKQLDGIGEIVGAPRPISEAISPSLVFAFAGGVGKGFGGIGRPDIGGRYTGLNGLIIGPMQDPDYRILLKAVVFSNFASSDADAIAEFIFFLLGQYPIVTSGIGTVALTYQSPISFTTSQTIRRYVPVAAGIRLDYQAFTTAPGGFGFAGREANTGYSGIAAPPVGTGYAGLVGGTAPVLFNPIDLFADDENGDWWDPNVVTSMSINTNGTGGIPALGDPVGTITGLANGIVLAAPSNAARGILRQINGRLLIEFDGIDDIYESSIVTGFPASSALTFVGWRRQRNLTDLPADIHIRGGTNPSTLTQLYPNSRTFGGNTQFVAYNGTNLFAVKNNIPNSIEVMHQYAYIQRATNDHEIRFDNSIRGNSPISRIISGVVDNIGIGGWYPGGSQWYPGHTGATLVINRALTDDELINLYNYGNPFPPPPPFTPSALFGVGDSGDWWDSNLSAKTIARDGTGPAAGVGDVVGRIIGLKNGLIMEAPTDAARPLLESDAGKLRMLFDGVDDRFNCTQTAGFNAITQLTLAGWARKGATTVFNQNICFIRTGNTISTMYGIYNGALSNIYDLVFFNELPRMNPATTAAAMKSFICVARANNDHEYFRDGLSIGTSTAAMAIGATDNFDWGALANFGQFFKGHLAALLIINRGLTNQEIADLHNWGVGRFGA